MDGFSSPLYAEYDGFRLPSVFSLDSFRSARNYQHKPGQIYAVSYPKSGSTWLQQIIILILRKGKPLEDGTNFFHYSPLLERVGGKVVDSMDSSSVVKSHLPFNMLLSSPYAKYVYIARNPKDVCVSFFYHTKKMFFYNFQDGTFSEFFDLFISEQTDFGGYFDNISSWYVHKNDTNVHFITYENLKANTKEEVLKLAKFMGEEYYKEMTDNPKCLGEVLHYSSFEYMTRKINESMDTNLKKVCDLEDLSYRYGSKDFIEFKRKYAAKNDTCGIKFVRKGAVGDWKTHFTTEQEQRMDQWIRRKTEGSDIMNLWKDIPA